MILRFYHHLLKWKRIYAKNILFVFREEILFALDLQTNDFKADL